MTQESRSAEQVRGDFQFLEGPVWVPGRNELIFSDIPASRIYCYSPATNSFSVLREPSGQANGNALDPQGRLVTCEHENRRTSRTEADGTVIPLATHYEGKRLNSPNDIVCRSDGGVYFSDPPYGVKAELRELDFQGVYRIEPTPHPSKDGSSASLGEEVEVSPAKEGSSSRVPLPGRGQGWVPPIKLLVRDFIKPNGLAFSPDERILYIADTELGHIRAFDVNADGSIANSRVFCKVERPDGFRVDIEGNLYISAMVSVEIFDRSGKKFGEITLSQRPANVAFGDVDRKTLYICARTGLYKARVNIPGVAMP
jgi:sugar lactone lactonase YvrE